MSLVEHAEDSRAPEPAAWLLSGSVAVALAALVVVMAALHDARRLPSIYRPVSGAMVGAAAVVLGAGWWRPAPWLLALILVLVMTGSG